MSRSRLRCLVAGVLSCAPFTLPAQQVPTHEGYLLTADGVRLFYRVYGQRGDTIIYLHGGPGGTMERQMPNLLPLARSHVVIAYDQRGGAGRSEAGDTLRITLATHVSDLETVRRHFGVARPTLMGHSWGTGLAVMYAGAHPDHVARLILNGPMPPARHPFDEQRWAGIAARVAENCAAALGPAATAEALSQCRERPDPDLRVYFADTLNIARDLGRGRPRRTAPAAAQRAMVRALSDWDYRPALRRIRVPALVVEGARTPIPLDQVRVWAEELPDGRLLLIEGAGHGYAYIEQPDIFFPAMEEFLAGRWPRDAAPARDSPD